MSDKQVNKIETRKLIQKEFHIPHFMNTKWLSFPYLIWMAGFIIIPLVMIIIYGLSGQGGGLTLENIALIFDPMNRKALLLSLGLSILSTLLCLALAYPLAMILVEANMKSNSFIVLVIILPMWMNFLLRTIAWQNILEKTGVLNSALEFFHLPAVNIINTPSAIVLGMVYNFLPFMVLPIYNVLSRIDQDVINAARDLGANGLQTFGRIIFPLTLPGVISGITMVFVPSLTTFVISTILGGSKIVLIGNVIEQQFRLGNWHTGSGLSLVLMIFILLSMAILSKYDKGNEGGSLW
jgi:ABC-type spermidine/putrescine transport system, permease component I